MDTRDLPQIDDIRQLTALPTTRELVLGGIGSLRRKDRGPATLPTGALRLDRAVLDGRQIAGYAKVCGFTDRQGVPATFPHMLGFPLHMAAMLRPDFPYPLIGLVHLANDIRQHAELRAGESLSITVRFGEPFRHDKGQAFTLLTEAERDGVMVWESSSTYLRLGVTGPAGAPLPTLQPGPQPLSVEGRWRLGREVGPRYAALSGDRNPIHTSRLGARLLGFKRPIAHGMWMLAKSAGTLLPDAPVSTARIEVAFRTPAFLPGTALLLATRQAETTLFELRNGSAERLHLSGRLTAEVA